ncbi:hypothetical protein POTOM_030247 [Populus tomentosa]|uniref:Peptidase S9 prolyl oligopeptidase catalytic domain-containing protein n=1 Tax=Populus tomentosa TaxID=118781 RepID=A0A8X7Z6V4_POPTO|nr:hypothetical protein POTOM_030247 [Populus tomentosa]
MEASELDSTGTLKYIPAATAGGKIHEYTLQSTSKPFEAIVVQCKGNRKPETYNFFPLFFSHIGLVEIVKTPIIFVLGAQDRRVPLSNGLQYAWALKEKGVEVKILMFPNDVHAIERPQSDYEGLLNIAVCFPLDTIKDLDGALNPWEDTLSNRDRNMILKEQSNWERALEIFEWFKGNGCYELYVIQYNIMLRILDELENGAMLNVCVMK